MKAQIKFKKILLSAMLIVIAGLTVNASGNKYISNNPDSLSYTVYKGIVIDAENKDPLIFATISVEGSNIATVTNADGRFILKLPPNMEASKLKTMYIGYETKIIDLNSLKPDKQNEISLNVSTVVLTEVNVFPNNPRTILDKVLSMRSQNYYTEPILMTGFYRETIQKRNTYVGLSEAVVQVYKQSYANSRIDQIKLFKGRKSTDTQKLDTLLFKLQGGPYSTLALDIVKDPYMILSEDYIDSYEFNIVNITRLDNKLNYVIEFKQKPYVTQPLFYGKMYIDIDQLAISSISFSLNTSDKEEASKMFIQRKPMGVHVWPESADYMVNYREQNGKWQYNYSRGAVTFKVDWDRKLLNSYYTTNVEMAITNWEKPEDNSFKPSDRLKMNVIMGDAINGFTDNEFWGEYNIIEPEQSIESAIKKIKKKLSKLE